MYIDIWSISRTGLLIIILITEIFLRMHPKCQLVQLPAKGAKADRLSKCNWIFEKKFHIIQKINYI